MKKNIVTKNNCKILGNILKYKQKQTNCKIEFMGKKTRVKHITSWCREKNRNNGKKIVNQIFPCKIKDNFFFLLKIYVISITIKIIKTKKKKEKNFIDRPTWCVGKLTKKKMFFLA